ncbi:MAG: 2-iminoacetate synthase ThiH [Fibrobacterota bacterium]
MILIQPPSKELLEIARGEIPQRESDRLIDSAISDSTGISDHEFAALLSERALCRLEESASAAKELTLKYFGRTVELYIPLYISNYCSGGCAYCGFASDRNIKRRRLSKEEIRKEASGIASGGFDEILLLTGERGSPGDLDHLSSGIGICAESFNRVTAETFPMETAEYTSLVSDGLFGITVYQETYDREIYEKLHRWGKKKDFDYRYETPFRALLAGARQIGTGALLGLSEPAFDLLSLAAHAKEIRRADKDAYISISFPRIRPEPGGFDPAYNISDRRLAAFIFAFRLKFPHFHLVLSTREGPVFRDGMAGLGISKMSTASRTTVGGYLDLDESGSGKQFEISDKRSRKDFCAALCKKGLTPVYKNWDRAYIKNGT